MNVEKELAHLVDRLVEATELLDRSVDILTAATVTVLDVKDAIAEDVKDETA